MAGKGRDTKARMEEAAIRLFAERGVEGTSVRDIAAAVGVTEAALYRHLTSKDEFVAGLFADRYVELGRQVHAAQDGLTGFAARMRAMVEACCRLHDRDPSLFRFLLIVQHRALPSFALGEPNPGDVIGAVIADGIREGVVTIADPRLATAIAFGCVLQPAVFLLYGRLEGGLADRAPEIAGAILRALGGAAP
jgi:AcrR family transcriptional regulator